MHAQSSKEITDKAQKVSARLQQKLLLTDDQTAKIKSIVIDNFGQIKDNKTAAIETKIISLLNDKQKEKFTIIKKEWLQSLQAQ
jgi:hypothetical protein